VYAALILHDDGLEVTSENIAAILKASNVEIEPYWPTLFAKLCKGKDIGSMLSSVAAAAALAAALAAMAAPGPSGSTLSATLRSAAQPAALGSLCAARRGRLRRGAAGTLA